MATIPDFKFYRDWIMHDLGEIAMFISDIELQATMAEINREVLNELRFKQTIYKGTISYTQLAQSADLPADCLEVVRVSHLETDGLTETFYDVIDWRDTGKRKYYEENSKIYVYCIGRKFYVSQQVTENKTYTVYYYPFLNDTLIATPSTDAADLGSAMTLIPVMLGRAFRYGCMADLMTIHGRTQIHEIKAMRWQAMYEKLVSRGMKYNNEIMPANEVRQLRNF